MFPSHPKDTAVLRLSMLFDSAAAAASDKVCGILKWSSQANTEKKACDCYTIPNLAETTNDRLLTTDRSLVEFRGETLGQI